MARDSFVCVCIFLLTFNSCKLRSSQVLADKGSMFTPWGAAYNLIPDRDYSRSLEKFLDPQKAVDVWGFHNLASSPQPYICDYRMGFVNTGSVFKKRLLENKKFRDQYMLYRSAGAQRKFQKIISNLDSIDNPIKRLSDLALEERFTPASLQALLLLSRLNLGHGHLFISHLYAQAAYQESLGIDLGVTQQSLADLVHLYSVVDFGSLGLPAVDTNQIVKALAKTNPWNVSVQGKTLPINQFLTENTPAEEGEGTGLLGQSNRAEFADALRFSMPSPNAYFNPFEFVELTGTERFELITKCEGAPPRFGKMLFSLFLNGSNSRQVRDSLYWQKIKEGYRSVYSDPLVSPEYWLAGLQSTNIGQKSMTLLLKKQLNLQPPIEVLKRLRVKNSTLLVEMLKAELDSGDFKVNEFYCTWGVEALAALRDRSKLRLETDKYNGLTFYKDLLAPCFRASMPKNLSLNRRRSLVDEAMNILPDKISTSEKLEIIRSIKNVDPHLGFSVVAAIESRSLPVAMRNAKQRMLKALLKQMDIERDVDNKYYLADKLSRFLQNAKQVMDLPLGDIEIRVLLEKQISQSAGYSENSIVTSFYGNQTINYYKSRLGNTSHYETVIKDLYRRHWITLSSESQKMLVDSFSVDPKTATMVFNSIDYLYRKDSSLDSKQYRKHYHQIFEVMETVQRAAIQNGKL